MMKSAELQRQAQRRADRIAAFRAELAELEQERGLVLTPDQRTHLDVHYGDVLKRLSEQFDVDITESDKRVSWVMRVGSFLAGAALFAALVLFCHRIWGLLPLGVQAAIGVVSPLVFLGATELASRRRIPRYYIALLTLASGASFVPGLNALGSTWNTEPSANALLAWGLFAVLVAYAYHQRVLLAAGLLLLCAYTSALWISLQHGCWFDFLERGGLMIPAAAIVYALPWATTWRNRSDFDLVYRLCGAGAGLLALLILSKSHDLSCSTLSSQALATGCQIAGVLLAAAVVFHGLRMGLIGLVNLGAIGFVVFLYVRLQAWFWDWLPKYLFCLLVALMALALVLLFRRLRARMVDREGL